MKSEVGGGAGRPDGHQSWHRSATVSNRVEGDGRLAVLCVEIEGLARAGPRMR